MDLQAGYDKVEIHELLARYARGVDARDWDLWKSVFTEDAVVDYSSAGLEPGTRDAVAAVLESALAPVPMTQHFISNIEVVLTGDTAKVRAMFYNPMQLPGIEGLTFCGGYYHHDLVRTGEGWKSQHLVEENLWFSNAPAARG